MTPHPDPRLAAHIQEQCAHMSDKDIADQIWELAEKRRETSYGLRYSLAEQRNDTTLLDWLHIEQERRASVRMPATLDDVTMLVCSALAETNTFSLAQSTGALNGDPRRAEFFAACDRSLSQRRADEPVMEPAE